MKHVKTLNTRKLQNTIKKGGCGECQTSCQSACKTSCTVGNQTCEQYKQSKVIRQSFEADRARGVRSFSVAMHPKKLPVADLQVIALLKEKEQKVRNIVVVHQCENNGYDIVLDVNSGAIHVVDDVTYDVIGLFEEHSKEEIVNLLKE